MCYDSKNGYIYSIKICSVSSKIRNTVFSLLGGFEYKWHKVFIDNFYNSHALFKEMLNKNFNVCRTLRGRRGGSEELNSIGKKMQPNTTKIFQKGNVNIFLYKKKKSKSAVTIMSTFHNEDQNCLKEEVNVRFRLHLIILFLIF
ncbi:hypothetical protein CDIK_4279 [Cucumispora dikerogammari]|nr:hypothetical protein CDIK_4279 [Cucumispora dikerogammari]